LAYSVIGKTKFEANLEWRGWYLHETWLVESSVLATDDTVDAMCKAAYDALEITPLAFHSIYTQSAAIKFTPRSVASNKRQFLIDIEWGPPDGSLLSNQPQIQVGATTKYQSTNKDGYGDNIEVGYTYSSDTKWGKASGKPYTTNPKIQVLKPEKVLEYNILSSVNPEILADTLVGRVNAFMWHWYPAGTVLCTAITGVSTDWGLTWRVRYLFQFNWDAWVETVAYVDMVTGKPPSDLVAGTGIKDIDPYPVGNFNLLTEIA
jgi:hypothetical protein